MTGRTCSKKRGVSLRGCRKAAVAISCPSLRGHEVAVVIT